MTSSATIATRPPSPSIDQAAGPRAGRDSRPRSVRSRSRPGQTGSEWFTTAGTPKCAVYAAARPVEIGVISRLQDPDPSSSAAADPTRSPTSLRETRRPAHRRISFHAGAGNLCRRPDIVKRASFAPDSAANILEGCGRATNRERSGRETAATEIPSRASGRTDDIRKKATNEAMMPSTSSVAGRRGAADERFHRTRERGSNGASSASRCPRGTGTRRTPGSVER